MATQQISTEELDAILGDLDSLDELEANEVQVDSILEDDDLEDLESTIEVQSAKQEAYAKQQVSTTPDVSVISTKKEEEKPKVKGAAKPRMRTASMNPADIVRAKIPNYKDIVVLSLEDAGLDDTERHEKTEAVVDSLNSLAKKVGEKAVNLLQAVAGQGSPSVYTQIALDILKKEGECTLTDIKNAYLAHPYSLGTASAQSSQMMQLFPALGIANRQGSKLSLRPDSALFPMLAN